MNSETKKGYDWILEKLQPLIQEKNIDEVSEKSLILGSIEFLNQEQEPAKMIFISQDDITKSQSIKMTNMKLNLKFALDAIFAIKAALEEEEIWLILSILHVLCVFKEEMTKKIGVDETIVLFSIYRMFKARKEDIERYIKENGSKSFKNITDNDINTVDIEGALKNLEDIHAIELEEGYYHLIEEVCINFFKKY